MDDPTRLLDDPTAPPGLKEDLRAASEIAPQSYNTERGLTRLRTALVAGTAGAAAATSATASAGVKAGLAWAALAVVVAAGMGGALYVWVDVPQPSSAPEERARPHAPASGGAPAEPSGSDAVAPSSALSADETREAPAVEAVAPTAALTANQAREAPSPEAASPSPPTATDDGRPAPSAPAADPGTGAASAPTVAPEEDTDERLRAEIGQLAQIRSRLETAPSEALALAREGQRRFEGGMFGEERAALVVFALDRLGRRTEAEREARRFVATHPVGPFTSRVRAVLERE